MTRTTWAAVAWTLPRLWACSHEQLDFSIPALADAAASVCNEADRCSDGSVVMDGSVLDGSLHDFGDAGVSTTAMQTFSMAGLQFNQDPDGYPTTTSHWAPWCKRMESFEERCDTDIDEDCDGMVDEFPGLGSECLNGCNAGVYICDPQTNALFCFGGGGCSNDDRRWCGDGFLGLYEECDPNAPGERMGITCTVDCHRPLFVLCTTSGESDPKVCDEMHKCDARIGACMPVIGPGQPRCPKVAIEGGAADDFYPMLETEEGTCLVTCSRGDQCPGILSECYMGLCAAPL